MSIMDKFLNKNKKSKKEEFDEFDDLDNEETSNSSSDEFADDEFESDIDIEAEGTSGEFKEQKNNLKSLVEKNKKVAIGASVVVGLGVASIVAEPYITKMMNSGNVMNNSEFEQTSKQVRDLANSSVKEDEAIAAQKKIEREERMAKMKAEKEAKQAAQAAQLAQEEKQLAESAKIAEANKVAKMNAQNNKVNEVNKASGYDIKGVTTNNKTTPTSIINEKGHIEQKVAEAKMDSNFKNVQAKIEQVQLMHDPEDKMDPFLQEYDGTVNSRAMRNELSENMKLMKDYIEFLDTKKKFEEAKLVYEKKKQKGLFAEEITKVKQDFLNELEGMKSSMAELRALNAKMANKMIEDKKSAENSEATKANNELEARKMRLASTGEQKVYKIGANYILEETDKDGNTKIYRDGNAYKGAIIIQVTPEFLKVKEANGDNMILAISNGSEMSGSYATIAIPTPAKSGVENNDMAAGGKEVKDYTAAKVQEQKATEQDKESSVKSRFLN